MTCSFRNLIPAFGVLWAAFVVTAHAADAKMRVIESDAPGIAVGSVWVDDAKLPIPPGKRVRVLILPQNVTKVLVGPAVPDSGSPPWGGTRGVKTKSE
jgi:hypothetical protein